MELLNLLLGIAIIITALIFAYKKRCSTKAWISIITFGVLLSVFFMVLPTEWPKSDSALIKPLYNIISALLYSFKVLGGRQDISQLDTVSFTGILRYIYILINYASFIAAPILGSGLILSFVGDTLSKIRYAFPTLRKTYVFSELNDNSLLIAKGLRNKNRIPRIVFCNTKKSDESLIESARKLHGITLFCSCDSLKMKKLAGKYEFCAVSEKEDENIELTKSLIEKYNDDVTEKVNITAFAKSTSNIRFIEKMLAETKSAVSVRFIDKIALFCNNLIYENPIYISAEKNKNISVMIVGCGETGIRMLRTAVWYGQIDGYGLKIRVYDKKASAIEKAFRAECPELNPSNGYDIKFIETDICTDDFEEQIKANGQNTHATAVYVFTGDDSLNLDVSDRLFRIFRKSRAFSDTPAIFTWMGDKSKFRLFSTDSNSYLKDRNIVLAGNAENLFSDKSFFNSKLESLALAVHLCYNGALGLPPSAPEYKDAVRSFKTSEYDRRSSMATAIHITAKLQSCGILDPDDTDLTMRKAFRFERYMEKHPEELDRLSKNEHIRWNAFMRSEGYISADIDTVKKYAVLNNSHKDELSKLHPCITDWDGLKDLESFIDRELNKKNSDFRKYDIEIVKNIPEIILTANKLIREEQ